jgi:serine/threonine protein kinase
MHEEAAEFHAEILHRKGQIGEMLDDEIPVAAGEAEDTRCDIYSFGAMLYHMLTGRPPYEGSSSAQIIRRIIDHPQYVPEQSRALLDFQAGKDRGRIYRIAAAGWKPDRRPIDLGSMSAPELAGTLEHPNAWWRETRSSCSSSSATGRRSALRSRARQPPKWRASTRCGRSPASGLEAADVGAALQDPHARVRETAVRLAGSRIGSSKTC